MQYVQAQQIVTLLAIGIVAIVLILVAREIVCWYFKIHQVLDRMDLINKNLVAIREAITQQKTTP